jgi:hypothetical protein
MAKHWRRKDTERTCCDGLCNQGRQCPVADDPQIHSDTPIRTKHSLDELFGRRHFDPVTWEPSGFPLLPSLLAGAGQSLPRGQHQA